MRKIGTVLVVDDELPIREELKKYPWEEHGFQLIGAARHGKEALRICEQRGYPDILVTDITMPVMGGMELISMIKEKSKKTQFIILTCHQDFEYACQAIQYHVISYLLKNEICREEMKECVKKASRIIELQNMEEQGQLRRQLLKALQAGGMAERKEIELILKKLGWEWEKKRKTVFLFLTGIMEFKVVPDNILEQSFREDLNVLNWIVLERGCYALLLEDDSREAIDCILQSIESKETTETGFNCGQLRAVAVRPERALLFSYIERLSFWKENLFYFPGKTVVEEREMHQLQKRSEYSVEEYKALLRKHGDSEEFKQWVRKNYLYPKELKRLLIECMRRDNETDEVLFYQIADARDMEDVQRVYAQYIKNDKGQIRYEIAKALDIMHAEYAESLTLNGIAERVHLSPTHFSKLFSEAMGEGMVNYLFKIRMEKAIDLMRHSNLKVYEVAKAVGIPSYRYFTACFKKYTGRNPQDIKQGKMADNDEG